MDYIEKYLTVKYFNVLVPEYKRELAERHKTTVSGLLNRLVSDVFDVKRLTGRQKEVLAGLIPDMDYDEIDMLEKVNHLPMRHIYEFLKMKGEKS